jgi:hypothetical protein
LDYKPRNNRGFSILPLTGTAGFRNPQCPGPSRARHPVVGLVRLAANQGVDGAQSAELPT